jgi:hypothetical protein
VPDAKFVEQTPGGCGFAQLISLATVGFDVLVTEPSPEIITVKAFCCAVKIAPMV